MDRKQSVLVGMLAILAGVFLLTPYMVAEEDRAVARPAFAYAFSEVHTHGNVSVYFIRGPETFADKNLMTLEEALDTGEAVLHETGQVSELSIENTSSDRVLYIQSGDVVKGGRQDRTIRNDALIPPKSGKIPVASFCVEQGRWSQRSGERADRFNSSRKMLSSKALKIAAKHRGSQGEVWSSVADQQEKISANVGQNVRAAESGSSLQLSLENATLEKRVDEYYTSLISLPNDDGNILGCAFFINGEFNSAEAYGSHGLFLKIWPKLLRAVAVEGIAEYTKDTQVPEANAEEARISFEAACEGKQTVQEPLKKRLDLLLCSYEAKKHVLYDTLTSDSQALVHRSWMSLPEQMPVSLRPASRMRNQVTIQQEQHISPRSQSR